MTCPTPRDDKLTQLMVTTTGVWSLGRSFLRG
ncbi:MAG: hypothetical protein RLZZ470_1447, partial [Pseudomonadota bacterium]